MVSMHSFLTSEVSKRLRPLVDHLLEGDSCGFYLISAVESNMVASQQGSVALASPYNCEVRTYQDDVLNESWHEARLVGDTTTMLAGVADSLRDGTLLRGSIVKTSFTVIILGCDDKQSLDSAMNPLEGIRYYSVTMASKQRPMWYRVIVFNNCGLPSEVIAADYHVSVLETISYVISVKYDALIDKLDSINKDADDYETEIDELRREIEHLNSEIVSLKTASDSDAEVARVQTLANATPVWKML